MHTLYSRYRTGTGAVPETMLAWHLYGTGLESFGRHGRPVRVPTPSIGARELLARVDAAGLCFSDIKVLNQGGGHPRIQGRDLASDPVIPGHEVSVTIVAVGDELRDDYQVGGRFVVQADIYHKGVGLAFGYQLAGALCQYVVLGEEILAGDDGCYLIPVAPETGDAEAALSEPWACVEAAYRLEHRVGFKDGGTALIHENGGNLAYELGEAIRSGGVPARIFLAGCPAPLAEQVRAWVDGRDCEVVEAGAEEHGADRCFDDIVILGADSGKLVGDSAKALAKGGVLILVADKALPEPVEIDVGRIHYEATDYIGTSEPDISSAYARTRSAELCAGGATWIVGAGGPMGQMHLQRALEMPNSPQLVVATDVDDERLATVPERYGDLADERGVRLVCLNPVSMGQDAFATEVKGLVPEGFDDIVVMAPVAALVSGSAPWLKPGGVMNVFAGLPRGTMVALDLSDLYMKDARFIGTSGSAISDLEFTLGKTERGELSPNRSVAAVGGLNAAWEGLKAVKEGRFAGKIVIFPQIETLGLTELSALESALPEVAAELSVRGEWTGSAERQLITTCLAPGGSLAARHLEGRVALVTGAGQGLGRAIAERLAREGCRVVVSDINEEGVRQTAAEIAEATHMPTLGVAADVTSEEAMAKTVARAVEEWGRLDLLVSNAGILFAGELTEMDVERWRKVIDVNLVGYFIAAREAARVMIPQESGAIIQINSKSGKKGSFRNSAYAAAKFGGIGLTQSLALELAPHSIRVNAICPGNLLDSPLWVDSLYAQYAERWGISKEDVRRKYEEQVPLGRGCKYEDVADLVVFLASEQSSYMTGQAVNVTGGQEMR